MTPWQYLEVFVYGNYYDFEEHPDCVRRGVNAVITASHMADHYFHYCKREKPDKVVAFQKLREYLDYLYKKCSCLKDIRHIANACKHLYNTRDNSTIDSAGRIETLKVKSGSISEISFNILESRGQGTVIFTRKTGDNL